MIHGYVPFMCRRYDLVRSFTMLLESPVHLWWFHFGLCMTLVCWMQRKSRLVETGM